MKKTITIETGRHEIDGWWARLSETGKNPRPVVELGGFPSELVAYLRVLNSYARVVATEMGQEEALKTTLGEASTSIARARDLLWPSPPSDPVIRTPPLPDLTFTFVQEKPVRGRRKKEPPPKKKKPPRKRPRS